MVPPSQNAALGGCKIIIHAPGDKEKWEKITFFGFVEDNDVPESTRIPVYMGVQPIKLKNMFPLIVYRATGWDSYTFI